MKAIKLILPVLFFCVSVRSQNCRCPEEGIFKEEKVLKTFEFKNKIMLGLCGGSFETKGNDTIYSGLDLFNCGENKLVEEWGEIELCEVKKIRDKLFIEELYGIPVGKKFKEIWMPFYVNQFYFTGNKLDHRTYYRKDIRRYSLVEITEVIQKYKQLKKGNYDYTVKIANMLFWAYVSGSKEAEVYLNGIEKKFGPFDGGISEEWSEIYGTYQHYKEKSNHK